jgi:hypothetical protein
VSHFDRRLIGKQMLPVAMPGAGISGNGRVVYAILSHGEPASVVRLVRTIRRGSPNAPIVVHHDFTGSTLEPALFDGLGGLHLLRSTGPTRWGEWSLAATMLLLFEWISGNVDFDWLVLLSGRDYPLQPLAQSEGALLNADCDAFVDVAAEVADDPASPFWRRYHWQHYVPPPALSRLVERVAWLAPRLALADVLCERAQWRRYADGSAKLGLRFARSPFHAGLRCYKGSAWCDLSRAAVGSVLAFWQRERRLLEWMTRTHSPDETITQIALLADPTLRVTRGGRRFMIWEPGSSHPRVLIHRDLDAALASALAFGRKVDAVEHPGLPDALDARLSEGRGGPDGRGNGHGEGPR